MFFNLKKKTSVMFFIPNRQGTEQPDFSSIVFRDEVRLVRLVMSLSQSN